MEMEIAKVETRGRTERELREDIAGELADFYTGDPGNIGDFVGGIEVCRQAGRRIISIGEDYMPREESELEAVAERVGEATGTEWTKWGYSQDLAGRYYYARLSE